MTAVANISKGYGNALHDNVADNVVPASLLTLVLLEISQADASLIDYDNLSLLLANAGNTESAFTNYARIQLSDSDISTSTVNDTTDLRFATFANQTWSNAGGASNQAIAKLVVCYDPLGTDVDTNLQIVTVHDFVLASTNGGDVIAQVPAGGYYSAA